MALITCYVILCSLKVLSADEMVVQTGLSDSVYTSSRALQFIFMFILTRDLLITFIGCAKGKLESVPLAIVTHWGCSFCDSLVLLAFCIWVSVALGKASPETSQSNCLEVEQCLAFYKATKANMIIGYLYIFIHICCCPCALILMHKCYDPHQMREREQMRLIREYNGADWNEDQEANLNFDAQ